MKNIHDTGLLRLSLSLLVGLGLAACGGSDSTGPEDENNGQGEFSATVSGPFNASLTGYAWQSGTVVDPQTNQQGWVLYLGSQDNAGSAVYVVRLGDRPGEGSYPLTDLQGQNGDLQNDQFACVISVVLSGGIAFSGIASGGTLTITSSSSSNVRGSFSFQVRGFDPNTQTEVTATVSGTFNAINNDFAFPGI